MKPYHPQCRREHLALVELIKALIAIATVSTLAIILRRCL